MGNIIDNILSFEGDKRLIQDIINLIKGDHINPVRLNDTTIFFTLINSFNSRSESFRMSGNGKRSDLERK